MSTQLDQPPGVHRLSSGLVLLFIYGGHSLKDLQCFAAVMWAVSQKTGVISDPLLVDSAWILPNKNITAWPGSARCSSMQVTFSRQRKQHHPVGICWNRYSSTPSMALLVWSCLCDGPKFDTSMNTRWRLVEHESAYQLRCWMFNTNAHLLNLEYWSTHSTLTVNLKQILNPLAVNIRSVLAKTWNCVNNNTCFAGHKFWQSRT